jgi:3-dehydrosphinganine reductase
MYSFSLNEASASEAALEAVCHGNGDKSPDAVFLCAGGSQPGFFLDQDEASLKKGMDDAYWVEAWSALVRSILCNLFHHNVLPQGSGKAHGA